MGAKSAKMGANKVTVSAKDVSNFLYTNYGFNLKEARQMGKQSVKSQKKIGPVGPIKKAPGWLIAEDEKVKKSGRSSATAERSRTVSRLSKKKK